MNSPSYLNNIKLSNAIDHSVCMLKSISVIENYTLFDGSCFSFISALSYKNNLLVIFHMKLSAF